MQWRTLVISSPGKLSLKNRQLLIESENRLTLPLEDIFTIVLESPQVILSSSLLSALPEYSITLITCNSSHIPNGVLYPFTPYCRQLPVINKQIAMSSTIKKRIWQKIVIVKILNQAKCVDKSNNRGGEYLRKIAKTVKSGDSTNVESKAALFYFRALFGDGFNRNLAVWQNSALNYGYAIIRSGIARALVAHGLIPALGVHHCSELNNFNLADDLIEPYRALVDYQVYQIGVFNNPEVFDKSIKIKLVDLLYQDIKLSNYSQSKIKLLASFEIQTESLIRTINNLKIQELSLPGFI